MNKPGDKCFASNYRAISLLPIISEVLEKIVCVSFVKIFNQHNIPFPSHHGFRPKLSTEHAFSRMMKFIYKAVSFGNYPLGILVDYSKAFDTVDYGIFRESLRHMVLEEMHWNSCTTVCRIGTKELE